MNRQTNIKSASKISSYKERRAQSRCNQISNSKDLEDLERTIEDRRKRRNSLSDAPYSPSSGYRGDTTPQQLFSLKDLPPEMPQIENKTTQDKIIEKYGLNSGQIIEVCQQQYLNSSLRLQKPSKLLKQPPKTSSQPIIKPIYKKSNFPNSTPSQSKPLAKIPFVSNTTKLKSSSKKELVLKQMNKRQLKSSNGFYVASFQKDIQRLKQITPNLKLGNKQNQNLIKHHLQSILNILSQK